ncbi:MAG: hypothetical protein AB1673_05045 [Actinomycetota bacterium]
MRKSHRAATALVSGGLALALLQGVAPAAEPPVFTQPVQTTKADLDPGRLYSSPSFAIDPSNPKRMVAGFADLRTRRCGVVRTTDGGNTWTRPDASPGTADYPFCSQSQGGVIQAPMAFGGGNTVYMAVNGWGAEEAARAGGAVMVARSTDLGDSWETVVVRTSRGKTGEDAENLRPIQSIAVDRKNGTNDVVYIMFAMTRPGLTGANAVPAQPMVAVSRDGGRTFDGGNSLVGDLFESQAIRDQARSAATTTTLAPNATTTSTTTPPAGSRAATPDQAANFGSAGSRNGMIVRVDGRGNAYATWPTGAAHQNPNPPGGLALSKSTDGGQTWTTQLAIPFSYENATGGPAGSYPQMGVTREGSIHIVYNRNPTPELVGHSEVYHRASYDGGATWTEARNLTDDDPSIYAGQYFPNINIAPNGRIDVVWWDTRETPGMRSNDVFYTYSTDDGRTWSANQRVTDRTVDRRLGIWGLNYDIASAPGVGSANEYAVFGWDDTRNSDPAVADNAYLGGGLQDLYIAAAQFEPLGGGASKTAKIILAGTIGLLAVGLVLVLASMVTRKSSPAPTGGKAAKATDTKKAPAKTS